MKFTTGEIVATHGKLVDATDSTATAESAMFKCPVDLKLTIASLEYVPSAAVTGHDTNYASIIISTRTAAGTETTRATTTTKLTGGTGTWVAGVAEDLMGTWDGVLAAGSSIAFEITKAGTGAIIPLGCFVIHAHPTDKYDAG